MCMCVHVQSSRFAEGAIMRYCLRAALVVCSSAATLPGLQSEDEQVHVHQSTYHAPGRLLGDADLGSGEFGSGSYPNTPPLQSLTSPPPPPLSPPPESPPDVDDIYPVLLYAELAIAAIAALCCAVCWPCCLLEACCHSKANALFRHGMEPLARVFYSQHGANA